MDKRQKASQKEGKHKSTKINIHIISEYHKEKAEYPRIKRKRKYSGTQDPHHRPRIFRYQIMLNERAIEARSESSRESKVTPRKYHISLTGILIVTLKANKSREIRPRRQRSPSISSGDALNCFVFQVKSADFYRVTRIFDDLSFDKTKLHS
jgi:hypothetical protein